MNKKHIPYVFCITLYILALISYPLASHANDHQEPVFPLQPAQGLNQSKVRLGEKLFHDPRLSANKKISCASCHNLDKGGTDNLPLSRGISGKTGTFNAPTVFNTSNNFVFFWDGRAGSLKDQIDGPIHHPDEMGNNWEDIIEFLKETKEYEHAFAHIYGEEPTPDLVKDAIVEFEKSLITPNAPFDLYLKGNKGALSKDAQKGYALFKKYGCASCHQGQNIGGNMYQQFGVIGDYFKDRGNMTKADLGRYNITGEEFDKHVFKVPSLRNVAQTAPYFHDGTINTLENAVEIMAKYQVGIKLSKEEKKQIVAFLKSLTGTYKGEPISDIKTQNEAKEKE